MANHLAGETSPYLLQHAANPVDWYSWGEQALTLARENDKPILLSIGYSACHWCHVMAHESFENAEIAAVMNELFVNIKVDREERPDLDQIYQAAHQMLTGRPGGWPLTMFLTPDGTPFFGGTYFPNTARHGLPAFPDLCRDVVDVYRQRPNDVAAQNRSLREMLAATTPRRQGKVSLGDTPIRAGRDALLRGYDSRFGGFGGAPKFPHASDLAFLLRRAGAGDDRAREVVLTTLTRMAHGGIYDQLGGGFCRYSVDERWEIPHFEKMLYDNGQLLGLYADAWSQSRESLFARVVEETAAWAIREMQLTDGAFASSLDADSEGEEGRFYVWDQDQIRAPLSEDEWRIASDHWGLDGPPNFERAHWHLRAVGSVAEADADAFARLRAKLLSHRETRIRPARDDKVLTAWNALMIEGLARAGRIFARADWVDAARRALSFIRSQLWRDGRLLATARGGRAHLPGYLDDYAFLILAVQELMLAGPRPGDAEFASALANALLNHFEDKANGGFHFTANDHETLIHRPKPAFDNSMPGGNAAAALALLRQGRQCGDGRYIEAAERTLRLFLPQAEGSGGASTLLMALMEMQAPSAKVNDLACTDVSCPMPDAVLRVP
ncbi:MAG: thioredoxin domain-containing protein [Gammaproteobacteria bacterium]|nr:thioredoxin domain-containing protein [Gammaproteobacteria bacterium]MBU1414578.1 thioredoxin domain-containing protein [Gammaproteobacteria bacterium]